MDIKEAIKVVKGEYMERIINSFTNVDRQKQALKVLIDYAKKTGKELERKKSKGL